MVPADAVLMVAGFQVPVMPLVEVVGNIGAIDPLHIGDTALKLGVIGVFTVTVNVAPVAHCPTFGENV
jgi:hypothetical protein